MRKLLSLAIMLALPVAASAGEPECVVSFSGAQHDVCAGTSSTSMPALQSLLSLSAVQNSSLRLVKFNGPITEDQRAAVKLAGAKVISYAPHYAYIVRMPVNLDNAMLGIDGVVWSGPMMPALKIDANIYSELNGSKLVSELGITALEISVDSQANTAVLSNMFASIPGLTVEKSTTSGGDTVILASFNRTQLGSSVEALAMNQDVLAVGFRMPAKLENSQGHWLHQSNVSAPFPLTPVWDKGLYGCGQIVGELDSGLYVGNAAFRDESSEVMPITACTSGTGCPIIPLPNYNARKVVAYYNWSNRTGGGWGDGHGHGTHVAGSIIGNDSFSNPGVDCTGFTTPGGDTNLDGMAPGAKLVMQESGAGLDYLNTHGGNIYHAADVAYQNGARIHNNSWGSGCVSNVTGLCISGCSVTYNASARNADLVTSEHDNLLVVVAAGNSGSVCANGNNVGSPGNAKNIISVGATMRGTAGNAMAGFSSRGPTNDSRTKPDLSAQGNAIISAARNASGTLSMSGTSMATPTLSGLAALVRDYLARGFYPTGQGVAADAINDPSSALVKAILVSGANVMTGTGAGANPGKDQGFGRVHLDNSLYFNGDQSRLFLHDEVEGLETGNVDTHTIAVTSTDPLAFVLTWTDTAAAVGASPATVNSLRLEVQAPNGDVWTQKLPAGYSVSNANPTQGITTSDYDNLNNLHRIKFDTPTIGAYQVRVRGINVPQGPQKYALVATGGVEISMDPDYSLLATPSTLGVCAGSPAQLNVGVYGRFGFIDPVTLGVAGLPGAANGNFSVNPVTPADPAAISQLTIGNTGGLARGSYDFDIYGTSSGATPITHNIVAVLKVSVGTPGNPALTTPANGATGAARSPSFNWAADVAAESYTIEVATDSAFSNIVASGTPATNSWTPSAPLSPMTTYYWRVKANSPCGDSAYSATSSFTTGATFPEPYCPVTFPDEVEPISLVKFTGIDNRSSADAGPAHEDFLQIAGGAVAAGQSYPMVVEGNTAGNYTTKVNAFIDWNRNGTFEASETYTIGDIINSTGVDGKQAIANILVPASATPGPVRMRVMKKYNVAGAACNAAGYGQAEDYTLVVQGASATYTVSGTVAGLSGTGLMLQLDGANNLPVSANGSFTFPGSLADGSNYAVTIGTQPSGQECTVSNGSGTIAGADVSNVEVACAGSIDDRIFADGFDVEGVTEAFGENFDSYTVGSNVHGNNGWKGWGNDPTAGAIVSATQSASAPNSINIEGNADLIRAFSEFTSGSWTITAKQFIPAAFSGESYFIFQNVYSDTNINIVSWSTQVKFDSATNQLSNEDGAASPFTAPLVKDRWVDLKLVVDLDADLQTFWYDGTQRYSGSWKNQFPSQGVPGIAAIGSINLFANGASTVYYDDIRIVPTSP